MPKEDMLFVTTAGELDMQKILDAFWETVYEGQRGKSDGNRLENPTLQVYQKELEVRLKKLILPAYYEEKGVCEPCTELPERICGKEYVLEENALHISSIRLIREEGKSDRCLLELQNGGSKDTLTVSASDWTAGELHPDGNFTELEKAVFRAGLYSKCHVKGCTKGEVLYLDMFLQETSYQDT